MRLYEIDDIDRTWAETAGINLDVDTDYKEVIDILNLLVVSKSPSRSNVWMPYILSIENAFKNIMQAEFANDSSTVELKQKVARYLNEIQTLKARL